MVLARGDFDIYMVPNVLHGLTENCIVHELKEVLLKVVLRLGSLLGVKVNVFLEPCLLSEGQDFMHPRHFCTESHDELEVSIMDNVICFIVEVRYELAGRGVSAILLNRTSLSRNLHLVFAKPFQLRVNVFGAGRILF